MRNFVQARRGPRDLRRSVGLLVGGRANFLRELVDFGDYVGNLAQRRAQVFAQSQAFVYDARTQLHVFDRFARLFLDALDEFGNFLGGLGRFLSQLADLVRYHRKSEAVFTGAGCFDGRVQSEQVRLLGKIVDDFDDPANVIGALSEDANDLPGIADGYVDAVEAIGRLVHRGDAAVHFLTGTVGNVEQHFRRVSNALDRCDHLVDGGGRFTHTGRLRLCALDHVLHVDAHLVHGAGDFVNGTRCLQADLRRLVRSRGNLRRSAGHLRSCIAHGADQVVQTFHHAQEATAQGVALGTGLHVNGEVAARDLLGECGHFA